MGQIIASLQVAPEFFMTSVILVNYEEVGGVEFTRLYFEGSLIAHHSL